MSIGIATTIATTTMATTTTAANQPVHLVRPIRPRQGVFAVETKSRKKPAENGKGSAKVIYDGKNLKFPTHVESKPVEQASYQAKWLEVFLSSCVGESVRVLAALTLPGWFIEGSGQRRYVLVSNCRNPGFMIGEKFGTAMTDSLRKRIAHVLTERYPALDV